MTGWIPSPTPALDRTETRRDPRAGSDAAAALLQVDAFARLLDATLVRGDAASQPEAPRDARTGEPAEAPRRDAPERRDAPSGAAGRRGAAERVDAGERAASSARGKPEPDDVSEPEADTQAAEAGDDAAPDADPGAVDGDPGAAEDDLAALVKLMRPLALRAFQAAAVGGGETTGVNGAPGAARLPAGLRPVALGAQAAAAAPEPPVPPARIAGQVLQALGRAEGLVDGRGTVRLALDPAHLGKVDVTVSRRDGRLEVTFRVESAEAESALRGRSGELGQALLGKAAGWSEVQVIVVREGAEDEDAAHDDGGRPDHRERPGADDGNDTPEGREGES